MAKYNRDQINLKSNLVTKSNKNWFNVLFTIAEIATLILWIYDWSLLAIFVHMLAIGFALESYKAEIFFNTKNGNKQYIRKWLGFFFSLSIIASLVLLAMKSPYSALFVFCSALWPSFTVAKLEIYDKEQNNTQQLH
jgi:hypothetical protein